MEGGGLEGGGQHIQDAEEQNGTADGTVDGIVNSIVNGIMVFASPACMTVSKSVSAEKTTTLDIFRSMMAKFVPANVYTRVECARAERACMQQEAEVTDILDHYITPDSVRDMTSLERSQIY